MFIEVEWMDSSIKPREWEIGEDKTFKGHLITGSYLILETKRHIHYYPMHTIKRISTTKEVDHAYD